MEMTKQGGENLPRVFDNEKLFTPKGHITEVGFAALQQGRLDELGSLEVAEHLSFCDYCLSRYTALMDAMQQKLQNPMRDLIPQVQNLMRRRSFRVVTNRYFSMVAGVVLALALWQFGIFGGGVNIAPQTQEASPRITLSQSIGEFFSSAANGLNGLMSGIQTTVQSGFDQLAALGNQNQISGTNAAKGE